MATTHRDRTRPPEPTEERRTSDPQEIEFLPRREGQPARPRVIELLVRRLRTRLETDDTDAGVRAWETGDELLELYNAFPERTTDDCPRFVDFARTRVGLPRADVHEFLRVRHRTTREQARALGRKRLSLGFRLLELKGLETFEALARVDLPQPDGSTVRFPAPVRELQAAIALLDVDAPEKAPARLLATAKKHNEALSIARTEDPDLEGSKARFVVANGKLRLRAGTIGLKELYALAKHARRLEGER
jgi:hypothetical protein